jgi:hypothetical protein
MSKFDVDIKLPTGVIIKEYDRDNYFLNNFNNSIIQFSCINNCDYIDGKYKIKFNNNNDYRYISWRSNENKKFEEQFPEFPYNIHGSKYLVENRKVRILLKVSNIETDVSEMKNEISEIKQQLTKMEKYICETNLQTTLLLSHLETLMTMLGERKVTDNLLDDL